MRGDIVNPAKAKPRRSSSAWGGTELWSCIAMKKPTPEPPISTLSVASGQPDVRRISWSCKTKGYASLSLVIHQISTGPFGPLVKALIIASRWADDIFRSFRLSLNCNSECSATAVFSCCLANCVSTICCAALALAASFSRPATLPERIRFCCSKFRERVFAWSDNAVAAAIRASASRWIASCTLFPELQTKYVASTVSTSRTTYAAKTLLCSLCAAWTPPDG